MTTKKFIVIEVDTFAGVPPDQLQQQAHRKGQQLFGLLTYIGYKPDWVRCTIYRDDCPRSSPSLPKGLVDLQAEPEGFTQVILPCSPGHCCTWRSWGLG